MSRHVLLCRRHNAAFDVLRIIDSLIALATLETFRTALASRYWWWLIARSARRESGGA